MLSDGTRTACSNAQDPTLKYMWRKDGEKDGICFGMDFKQAQKKQCYSGQSSDGDRRVVCQDTRISMYVPYAYDAAIALAHGLDKLVKEGFGPNNMTAILLSQAIKDASDFDGVSGRVSFKENGDREESDLEYIVYNYQVKGEIHGFEDVGRLIDGEFDQCINGKCRPGMMFFDGSRKLVNVNIVVSDRQSHVFSFVCCPCLRCECAHFCGVSRFS